MGKILRAAIIIFFVGTVAGGVFSDNPDNINFNNVPSDSQTSPASSPSTSAICNPPDSCFSGKTAQEEIFAVENPIDSSPRGKTEPNQNKGIASQKSAILPPDDPTAPQFIGRRVGPIPPP